MSDQDQSQQDQNNGNQSNENAEKVLSIEDIAREQGWRPKEEWDGDSTKWVSAETFVAKGELIDKIESLGKKLKNTEKALEYLKDHHSKVKEKEFQNAVAFLKKQKKEAYENGDIDKIIELDEKISDTKETFRQQQESNTSDTQEKELHPNFVKWMEKNSWYNSDEEMREDADEFGILYAKRNPDKTPEEVLEYVERKIKRLYKDKFENPNRARGSAVEGGTRGTSVTPDTFTLSDEEKRVMHTFIRQGIMTEKEYIDELKKVRG